MLRINDITKQYGSQLLFDGASLQMSGGERLGLIGRNGSGKTTLFRFIIDQDHPDSGTIEIPKHYRVGYLEQHLNFIEPTVLEVVCAALPAEAEHEDYRAKEILFGLGFDQEDMARAPAQLSGGYQVRLQLARTLVSSPNLLLLDEPTNYLDIVSVRWITRFLNAWRNELIIISHDREFMDAVTTHTAMIHRRTIRTIKGPTQKVCAQIAEEEEAYEKTRINEERRRAQLLSFVERFKAKNTKASAARSKMKMIEKMPLRDKLECMTDLDFRFHYSSFPAKRMMEIEAVSFAYPQGQPLIEDLSMSVHADDRIAIIGKNGKGKSTLLRLLAGELAPSSGERKIHHATSVGYYGQTNIDRLAPQATIEEEIGSANPMLGKSMVRGICGTMMFGGELAEKKVTVLSGGEKSRVLLGKIMAAPANLLLLDEPSNHLDMQSIEALVDSIDEFPGAVVIVTHDEMILRSIATRMVIFQGGAVEIFDGSYDEFLEKRGWDEERDLKSAAAGEERTVTSKKDVRRMRAQIIEERSSVIRPLKERIDAAETAICELEEESAQANRDLLIAAQNQEGVACVALTRSIKEMQASIDAHFVDLEKATLEYERLSKVYEERLTSTEG